MRLIDADAIEYKESIIDTTYRSTDDVIVWDEKRTLKWVSKEDIDKTPTIDAEPVRHGHWTRIGHIETWVVYKCSMCENQTIDNGHYCPNCGAKMDEVNE